MGSAAEPYAEAALDTLSGAALASVIAGNNTSADQLAAQMLGSVIGTAIAQPAVKAIKEYKAGQAELAAERKVQLQMEAPSPDLTTDQLTNYYNENQDQYMTGRNTPSSAAANSTSQSSLNSGASAKINNSGSMVNPVTTGNSAASLGKFGIFSGEVTTPAQLPASNERPNILKEIDYDVGLGSTVSASVEASDVLSGPAAGIDHFGGTALSILDGLYNLGVGVEGFYNYVFNGGSYDVVPLPSMNALMTGVGLTPGGVGLVVSTAYFGVELAVEHPDILQTIMQQGDEEQEMIGQNFWRGPKF